MKGVRIIMTNYYIKENKMNTIAKKVLAIVALASVAMMSSAAFADATINGLLRTGENQFQDTDAERIIRDSTVITSGVFQEGDVIQTILRFTDINAGVISDSGGVYNAPYQLIGYGELRVDSIITTGLPSGYGTLVFAPTGNLGAGVFAELYERTTNTPGIDFTIDPATAIAQVRSQTLIAEIGISDVDDFWTATTLLNITAAASAIAGGPQAANGVFGLTVLTNAGNLPYDPNSITSGTDFILHDVVGSASAYVIDTNANNGWLVSSNTTLRFNAAVPEPSVLALMSMVLLVGAGMIRLTRRHS